MVLRVVIGLLFTSTIYAQTSAPRIQVTDRTLTLVDLLLNWVPEPEFGGFYAAEHLRLFEKHGLKVNIIPGGAGTPTVQMLAAGQSAFVITSGSEIVVSRSKGTDVTAIYNVYETSPMGIMVHESRGFKSLPEFLKSEGVFSIQRGLAFADFLERKFGFGKLKIVPYTGGVASFVRDENFSQQGFIFSEPVSAKRLGAKPKFFLLADVGYNPYVEVVAAKGDYLQKNEEIVKSFVEATKEGWAAYIKNPTPINEVMAKLNPAMDLAAMNEGAANQAHLLGDGKMNEARWKEHIDLLFELKNISKPVEAKEVFRNF